MAVVVDFQLAVGQVPHLKNHNLLILRSIAYTTFIYLDNLIPTGRNDNRVGVVRREPNARHPIGVAFLRNSVLALSEGVPQLDRLVPTARDNLPIVD